MARAIESTLGSGHWVAAECSTGYCRFKLASLAAGEKLPHTSCAISIMHSPSCLSGSGGRVHAQAHRHCFENGHTECWCCCKKAQQM
mmetsp:Transcript_4888/g.11974  ORF Transcript_4888/g.11974 Transcript_4888/m.11974 type:complete len:87 (-) Transcript_4888:21-281(-)